MSSISLNPPSSPIHHYYHIPLPNPNSQPPPLIILPTHLNQPLLLILSLRSPRPIRRLINPLFFLFISFLFCLVHGLRGVFGWRVDRVEDLGVLLAAVIGKGRGERNGRDCVRGA